ncbi:MAG: replicative DNA helicase [Nitrospirota bacterium]
MDQIALADRIPPQHVEAEEFVLGAILLDNQALNKVLEVLSPNAWYREAHRKIFQAMIDLSETNEAIDQITVCEQLRRRNELEQIGGAAYLAQLVAQVPTAANVRHHAKIVQDKSLLRNLITVATDIVASGYQDVEKVDDLIDQAERKIFELAERRMRQSFIPVRQIVKGTFEMIERLYERKELVTGVPTGFSDLDKMTAGLQPSDLIILAGRPSMGKTALALNMAQHAATKCNETVAIFSLEMSKEQLVLRMLCSEARVDAHKLRSGFLAREDWRKLTDAASRLSEAKIFIDDTPGMTVLEMRAKARRLKAEHRLALVIVDYLQLMRGRGDADNREQEISDISRSLKGLAKELNVPVIALSQLSRAVETRGGDKKPQLSDLRESGAIEQDADVVMFVFREEVYRQDENNRGVAEILVRKQRNGPTGEVALTFLDRYTRFEDASDRRADNPL